MIFKSQSAACACACENASMLGSVPIWSLMSSMALHVPCRKLVISSALSLGRRLIISTTVRVKTSKSAALNASLSSDVVKICFPNLSSRYDTGSSFVGVVEGTTMDGVGGGGNTAAHNAGGCR